VIVVSGAPGCRRGRRGAEEGGGEVVFVRRGADWGDAGLGEGEGGCR
jgi:hypothetical protein